MSPAMHSKVPIYELVALAHACHHAARAMELFLKKLVEGTCNVAQSRQAKTVSTSHL